ncbi:MAG: cell division protein ZapA [Methylococcales bacterium]
MNDSITAVTIQVLGKEYRIGCTDAEQPDLLESARYLDQKMREIKDAGRVVGVERIAVMAALNIVHELTQSKRRGQAASPDILDRLISMREKIDAVFERK